MLESGSKSAVSDYIYLDYNATTPLAGEVIEDCAASLAEDWANPSSSHPAGLKARQVVDKARKLVAEAVGAQEEDIIFTSGGTEANNMVVLGCEAWYRSSGRRGLPHVVASDVEHDAVREPLRLLERQGRASVTWLSCADGGRVCPEAVLAAVTPDTCLVTVMMANNETGVLSDIGAIGRLLSNHPSRDQIWYHTDSAQTVGKVEVDVQRLQVDFLTIVGHKMYGPRVGALYSSRRGRDAVWAGAPCLSLLYGGGQERSLRPGTENTALLRGLGTACQLVTQRLADDSRRIARLRDLLERQLLDLGVAERVNWAEVPRLPNTSSVVLAGDSSALQVLQRAPRLLASTGAACHAAGAVSGVLLRSGVPEADARRTLRLSLGRHTTEPEVVEAVRLLQRAVLAPQDLDG